MPGFDMEVRSRERLATCSGLSAPVSKPSHLETASEQRRTPLFPSQSQCPGLPHSNERETLSPDQMGSLLDCWKGPIGSLLSLLPFSYLNLHLVDILLGKGAGRISTFNL